MNDVTLGTRTCERREVGRGAQKHATPAPRGLFITFEGGDGTGKTTQAEALRVALEERGIDVLRTREPGGSPLGLDIRQILLHSRGHLDPKAEALLFAADRAQNVETQVRPALARGTFVVQDRYIDSSVAYQGAGRALDPQHVLGISTWASGGLRADLTVLLDLHPVLAAARVAAEGKAFDRIEAEAAEFRARLRQGFIDAACADPARFLVLDAALPAEMLTARIVSAVLLRATARGAVTV